MFDDLAGWLDDAASSAGDFLGSYEDLAPAVTEGVGDFLGGYEDLASYLPDDTFPGLLQDATAEMGVPDALNRAVDSQSAYANGSAFSTQGPLSQPNVLQQIMKGMRLTDKDGNINLSDPKTLDAWMKTILGGANAAYALTRGNRPPQGYKTPQDVRSSLASGFEKFSPTQQAWADKYFNTPTTIGEGRAQLPVANTRSTISPSRGYARGGALGYVHGASTGQADDVPANLSSGEYVFDADVVSALGDGNNAAGAKILDEARERIRAHKRSASNDSIPPPAKPLGHYLGKGALRLVGAK